MSEVGHEGPTTGRRWVLLALALVVAFILAVLLAVFWGGGDDSLTVTAEDPDVTVEPSASAATSPGTSQPPSIDPTAGSTAGSTDGADGTGTPTDGASPTGSGTRTAPTSTSTGSGGGATDDDGEDDGQDEETITSSPDDQSGAKAAQTVGVRTPDGEQLTLAGDTAVDVTWTLFTFEHQASALDTGLPVTVSATTDSCSVEGADGSVFMDGGSGDVCRLRVQVPGDAAHLAFDSTLSITFVPTGHVSWKVAAEPASPGCYTPGSTIGDLVLEPAGSTETIWDVGVRDSTAHLQAVPEHAGDGRRLTVRLSVADDAPPGRQEVTVAFSAQGQYLSTADQPTVRDYEVATSCEDTG